MLLYGTIIIFIQRYLRLRGGVQCGGSTSKRKEGCEEEERRERISGRREQVGSEKRRRLKEIQPPTKYNWIFSIRE